MMTRVQWLGQIWTADSQGAVRLKSVLLITVGGVVALVILAVVASALSNLGLPAQSEVVDRLSPVNKARLEEVVRVHAALGNQVWPASDGAPGWGDVAIPVIVHNEAYAFLVGYPGEPPDGWLMMPREERRGGPWEPVPDDTFRGAPYYRQRLAGTADGSPASSGVTPENFTVRVGDHWAATLFTKEYAEIAFYRDFRRELPGFLQPIFPYRLAWQVLMGPTENYVGGLAHEAFHAYQGTRVPERLAAAERVQGLEASYPFDAAEEAWRTELDALHTAAQAAADPATPEDEVARLADAFLTARAARREAQGATEATTGYERQREWLEGLAKYAELTIALEAGEAVAAGTYTPTAALDADRAFKGYRTRARFWSAQLDEVKRMANRSGETRFYYSGFAQGVVLDRLAPGWKARAFEDGVWLEDLLAEAR